MAADFRVETGQLSALTSQILDLVGQLNEAGNITPDPVAAGHPSVEASLETFFSHWTAGLQKTETTLQQMSSRLASAAAQYAEGDSLVSGEFNG